MPLGPKAPAGLESNWVDTSASKGWFVWFRFYGPTEALILILNAGLGSYQEGEAEEARPASRRSPRRQYGRL